MSRDWLADLEKLVTIASYAEEYTEALELWEQRLLEVYGPEGLVRLMASFTAQVLTAIATEVGEDHEVFRERLFAGMRVHAESVQELFSEVEGIYRDMDDREPKDDQ
ncbi:hypothetical protein IEE94_11385 [Yimella sp. cx-573]|nr:hypothetical protein [Yimella sp. cx-573]